MVQSAEPPKRPHARNNWTPNLEGGVNVSMQRIKGIGGGAGASLKATSQCFGHVLVTWTQCGICQAVATPKQIRQTWDLNPWISSAQYIFFKTSATVTSNATVVGAKVKKKKLNGNSKYRLLSVLCDLRVCVLWCVSERTRARVFVDNDEWALHQSNLLLRLHKGTTNHFRKHVCEEGLPCQMLSWASVSFSVLANAAQFSRIASAEARAPLFVADVYKL